MSGPLTRDQITSLWRSVTDPSYHEPLLHNPDSGLEVVTQSHEQFARASEMVDRTTQAMFIVPWSGQTDEPSAGAAHATVDVTLTRTTRPATPLTIPAGTVLLHSIVDPGEEGGVEFVTARRYLTAEDAVFGLGEMGPVVAEAVAERPGYAHNLPLPGTISRIDQPGAGMRNFNATHLDVPGHNWLWMSLQPDALTHFQVGQHVELLSGPSAGQVRRVVDWDEGIELFCAQQQKLLASDAQAGDEFGCAVAIDGDAIVVGARTEDAGGADAGAAYVYTRAAGVWTEQQKLLASDAQAGDRFGCSVGIDGDTIVVGA
jgi:hypothetical protein